MLFQGKNWLFIFIVKSAHPKQPFGQRCFFCAQPELTPVLLLTSDEGIYLFHLPACLFCFCLSAFLSGILSKLSWSTNYTSSSPLALFQYVCLSSCPSVCLSVSMSVLVSVCLSDTSGVLSALSSSTNWLAAHSPRLVPPASIYKLPTAADRLHTLSLLYLLALRTPEYISYT